MPDSKRGTGPNCNSSEELVALLMARLTLQELGELLRAHPSVLKDSIAEAYDRRK